MRYAAILAFLGAMLAIMPVHAVESAPCKLFTRNEAAAYIGASLGEGEDSLIPGAAGCAWSDKATGNKLSVSVFPAGNALQLKAWGFEGWEGFRSVPGIGARAYVARSPVMEIMGNKMGGEWQAGAIVGNEYISVGLKGPKANPESALAALKDTIARRR